jgi:hypothetical protein
MVFELTITFRSNFYEFCVFLESDQQMDSNRGGFGWSPSKKYSKWFYL